MSESPHYKKIPTAQLQRARLVAETDAADAERRGREAVLTVLIPTLDALERMVAEAVAAMPSGDSLVDDLVLATIAGVDVARGHILDALERLGVRRLDVLIGAPYDSVFHEAVEHVQAPSAIPVSVVSQRAPGYALGTRLLRRALVVVSEAPRDDGGPAAA
jgi:molecular chaperone GrpE